MFLISRASFLVPGSYLSFEVKEKDLLARIGKLKTKSGTVDTPLLFPVVNPGIQLISPKRLKEDFGFGGLITNAYILKRRYQNRPLEMGVHKFLDFDGIVMTDSGAYQILVYGGVEVNPAEIISYQESIGSDIATILDIPTGWKVTKDQALLTVEETLRRARDFVSLKTRDDIIWVGPVQGGRHLDLVAKSALEMGRLPFQIHALGSPTEIMESYRFDVLVDMIMAAKTNLPIERPLHLFGAGHPIMFSLAVALGCDLFDSASYALYARENRYMTEEGTWRLSELDYFPCQCPKCVRETPKEILDKPLKEQEMFLAEHNLYACLGELRRIRQAIRDGLLWEHLEMRAHAHPALLNAMKNLKKHKTFIEKQSPTAKRSGLFFFNSAALHRPEVVHYNERLSERFNQPPESRVLLLLSQSQTKPYHKSREFQKIDCVLKRIEKDLPEKVHVCFYAAPFGVIPLELDEVYPLSQHDTAISDDQPTLDYVAARVSDFVTQSHYESVVLVHDPLNWRNSIKKACQKESSTKGLKFNFLTLKAGSTKTILTRLEMILRKNLSEST